AVAVPLAAADEFQDQRPDPAVPAAADLYADACELHLALAQRVLVFLRQQPVERVVLDRARLAARRSRILCAVEMGWKRQALPELCDPGDAHGAADRVHHSLLPV